MMRNHCADFAAEAHGLQILGNHLVEERVTDVLVQHGWTRITGSTAIASKSFDTVVGKRVAHAYLTRGDGYNRALRGDYQSRGDNILSARGVLIPQAMQTADELREFVETFAKNAEEAIADSYAVRLLRLEISEKASQ